MFFGRSKSKVKEYIFGYKNILEYLHENMMHKDITVYVGHGNSDKIEMSFPAQLGLTNYEINTKNEMQLVFVFDPYNLEMRMNVDHPVLMVPEDNERSCYISCHSLNEQLQIYLETKS